MVTVIARIGEIPPDHKGHDMPSDELRVVSESYEKGSEELKTQVPDGWRILSWRVEN